MMLMSSFFSPTVTIIPKGCPAMLKTSTDHTIDCLIETAQFIFTKAISRTLRVYASYSQTLINIDIS